MQVKLRVSAGANAGKEIRIPVAQFLIGRSEACHLRPKSDAVSRRHCVLLTNEKQVFVKDLGSKNGIYVNGEKVSGTRELNGGDVLGVGPLRFEVLVDHGLGGAKRPVVQGVKEAAARTAEGVAEDVDISTWLEEGPVVADGTGQPDTRQYRMEETDNIALETSAGKPLERQIQEPTAEEETSDGSVSGDSTDSVSDDSKSGRRKWKKAEPGKLPDRPSVTSEDSREAAADMLKKFFNRR